MSSLGSISSLAPPLLTQLRGPTGKTGAEEARESPQQETAEQSRLVGLQTAPQQAGLKYGATTQLRNEIDAAVQGVLRNPPASGNTQASIEKAIDDVLRKHGIDPVSFKWERQSAYKNPSAGTAGARPIGSSPVAANSQSAQSPLSRLLNNLSGTGRSGSLSIAGSLQGLPAGSQVDTAA